MLQEHGKIDYRAMNEGKTSTKAKADMGSKKNKQPARKGGKGKVEPQKTPKRRVNNMDLPEEGFQMEVIRDKDDFPSSKESDSDSEMEVDDTEGVEGANTSSSSDASGRDSAEFEQNMENYLLANEDFLAEILKHSRSEGEYVCVPDSQSTDGKGKGKEKKRVRSATPDRSNARAKGRKLGKKKPKSQTKKGQPIKVAKRVSKEILYSPSTTTVYEWAVKRKGKIQGERGLENLKMINWIISEEMQRC